MSRRFSADELGAWLRPPLYGGAWMNPNDTDVGTACYQNESFWSVFIHLQVRVVDGRIVEARCTVDDYDSKGGPKELAEAIGKHLVNRPLSTSLEFNDTIFWSVEMVREAIYDALKEWASARPERVAALPPSPYLPHPATQIIGRVKRVLRVLVGL